jgi:hypothetical protein
MSPFALFCYFDYIVVVNTLEGAVTEHFVNTNEQSDKYIDDHRYLGHDQSINSNKERLTSLRYQHYL